MCSIYGLFSLLSARCLYVGVTNDVRSREVAHKSNLTCGPIPFEIRVLKRTHKQFGTEWEQKIIAKFKKMGQCEHNKIWRSNKRNASNKRFNSSLEAREITSKIKAGIGFEVITIRERKKALTAAKYLGVLIHTRATDTGYYVHFLTSLIPNHHANNIDGETEAHYRYDNDCARHQMPDCEDSAIWHIGCSKPLWRILLSRHWFNVLTPSTK